MLDAFSHIEVQEQQTFPLIPIFQKMPNCIREIMRERKNNLRTRKLKKSSIVLIEEESNCYLWEKCFDDVLNKIYEE